MKDEEYGEQFSTVYEVVDASSKVYESVQPKVTYSGCINTDARFKILRQCILKEKVIPVLKLPKVYYECNASKH